MHRLLSSLAAIGLLSPFAAPLAQAQSSVSLEFRGQVGEVVGVPQAPFTGAAQGASFRVGFDVALPGTPGASNVQNYVVDASSVEVVIGGASSAGAPGVAEELAFEYAMNGNAGVGVTLTLPTGDTVSLFLLDVGPATAFSSGALEQADGVYPASAFDLSTGFLAGAGGGVDVNLIVDTLAISVENEVGAGYCLAESNSTGATGELTGLGSAAAADNDLTLVASSLPAFSFGFFIVADMQGFVQNPGGSSGNLCVSGAVGRYVGPGEIQQTDATGAFELALDLTRTPTPTGFLAVTAGDVLQFQTWYRDVDAQGSPTSNFTNGLSVAFQ